MDFTILVPLLLDLKLVLLLLLLLLPQPQIYSSWSNRLHFVHPTKPVSWRTDLNSTGGLVQSSRFLSLPFSRELLFLVAQVHIYLSAGQLDSRIKKISH